MSKSFRYVSEFEFPSDKGFSGSAGATSVKGYCRGGKVMKKAEGGEVPEGWKKDFEAIKKLRETVKNASVDEKTKELLKKIVGGSISDAEKDASGYCRGGKVMKKADGGVANARNAIRNERSEMQRVEAKRKDAGQELQRVRQEMAYDKNVVRGGQRPQMPQGQQRRMQGQMQQSPLGQVAQQGYCGGGKVKKADGGKVTSACKSEIRKDVHKHETAMHPGKPLTKMAKGGFNSTPLVGKQQAKVGKVMGEFKSGDLHSGSKQGAVVKSPKQALAIAMSEARKVGKKK